jgi:outer membrane cobalamin receptor
MTYFRPARAGVGVAVNFVGKRPDTDFAQFPSPRVTLPSYTKLDLSAELPVAIRSRGGVTLNARLENVLNKRYEDALHFPAPGRTLLIGARASTLF